MTVPYLQRLRYPERAFLRRQDFIAEQNYFLQLDRATVLATHGGGIAEGLGLEMKPKDGGQGNLLVLKPGVAFDAMGRRLVVPQEIVVDEEVLRRHGLAGKTGSVPVSLAYSLEKSSPPPKGYEICDTRDLLTRWSESVVLDFQSPAPAGNAPTPHDELSDDPDAAGVFWPVRLGTVTLDSGQVTAVSMSPGERSYVGSIGTHLEAPPGIPAADRRIDVRSPLAAREEVRFDKTARAIGKLETFGEPLAFRHPSESPAQAAPGSPREPISLQRVDDTLRVSLGEDPDSAARLVVGSGTKDEAAKNRMTVSPKGVIRLLPPDGAVEFAVSGDVDDKKVLRISAKDANLSVKLGSDPQQQQAFLLGAADSIDPANATVVMKANGDVSLKGELDVAGDTKVSGKLTAAGDLKTSGQVACASVKTVAVEAASATLAQATVTNALTVKNLTVNGAAQLGDSVAADAGIRLAPSGPRFRFASGEIAHFSGLLTLQHKLGTKEVMILFSIADTTFMPQASLAPGWEMRLTGVVAGDDSVKFSVNTATGSNWEGKKVRWWAFAAV